MTLILNTCSFILYMGINRSTIFEFNKTCNNIDCSAVLPTPMVLTAEISRATSVHKSSKFGATSRRTTLAPQLEEVRIRCLINIKSPITADTCYGDS
ncbi:unnamed protein product [Leptosia nina]|uniref:Uncharacterized protein n=1 Tax=Leptosia nina TaxID=320188 RepID=A0AAV1JTY4_9NEOP